METIETKIRKIGKDGRIGLPEPWIKMVDSKNFGIMKCDMVSNKKGEIAILITGINKD